MKKINILSVCGSGTVTSSMIANKVKDFAEDKGFKAKSVECNPSGVDSLLSGDSFDVIVHTSPLKKDYDLPTINAVGLLTGMDVDGFKEQFYKVLDEISKGG